MELGHNGLLEEIYDKAVNGSDYMAQVECEIAKKIESVLSKYKQTLSEQEFTELEEVINGSTIIAEKVSFMAGIRYGMQLFLEGLCTENHINTGLKKQE